MKKLIFTLLLCSVSFNALAFSATNPTDQNLYIGITNYEDWIWECCHGIFTFTIPPHTTSKSPYVYNNGLDKDKFLHYHVYTQYVVIDGNDKITFTSSIVKDAYTTATFSAYVDSDGHVKPRMDSDR